MDDNEIHRMGVAYEALAALDRPAVVRALRWLGDRLESEISRREEAAAQADRDTSSGSTPTIPADDPPIPPAGPSDDLPTHSGSPSDDIALVAEMLDDPPILPRGPSDDIAKKLEVPEFLRAEKRQSNTGMPRPVPVAD